MNNADEKTRAVIEALRVELAGMTPEQLAALQEDVADWPQGDQRESADALQGTPSGGH